MKEHRSTEQKQNLLEQQEQFEQQLFPKANKPRKSEQQHLQQQPLEHQRNPEKKERFDQQKIEERRRRFIDRTDRSENFLYKTKQSHPIIEYLPSEEESASLTPSFVLEVTWPRIIQFYHPSSPHCQSLQPVYVSVAREIKRRSSRMPVEFHAVNCGVYREMCEQGFNVRNVPIIIGLKSGRIDRTELSLPGSIDGAVGFKKDISMDVELKVEYLAQVMDIPLDAVKGTHSEAAFVKQASSNPIGESSDADALEKAPVNDLHGRPSSTSSNLHIPLSEQVFHDAMASLVVTFTSSLYSQYTPGSPLPSDTSRALSEFLDLIRWAYPPESKVHNLAEDLRLDYANAITSEEGLLKVIARHVDLEADITWSTRCGAEANGGFACGLWSLLHVLSIGVAERHTSVVGVVERVSVIYAGQVMRTFIDKFFVGCSACRDLWIQLYDDTCCALQGTDNVKLRISEGGKTIDEWRSLAIWIWEIHNEVTVRRDQLAGKGYYHKQPRMEPASSLWPTKKECPKCWQSLTDDTGIAMNMDSYDRNQLFNYLKMTYWPGGIRNNRLIVLERWNKAKRELSTKKLRARMAAYDWPMSILIIHILLIWLIIRVLIPNFCCRVCRCFGHRRVTRGGHRKKRPEDRSNPNENYHHSDKAGWNRHYDHSADFESSLKSRFRQTMHTSEKLAQKRGNREEEFHHYTAKMSHIRTHEGKRSHSRPGSQSVKNNHFNCILNL